MLVPPMRPAQRKSPDAFSFETKTSQLPALVKGYVLAEGSKSAVPSK